MSNERMEDVVWRILEIGINNIKYERGYPKVDDIDITDQEKYNAAKHIVNTYHPDIVMDE